MNAHAGIIFIHSDGSTSRFSGHVGAEFLSWKARFIARTTYEQVRISVGHKGAEIVVTPRGEIRALVPLSDVSPDLLEILNAPDDRSDALRFASLPISHGRNSASPAQKSRPRRSPGTRPGFGFTVTDSHEGS